MFEGAASSSVLLPKKTKYEAEKLIAPQAWLRGEYGDWLVQWLYTSLAGRLYTTSGGLRLYFVTSTVLILAFATAFYFAGLEWTTKSDDAIGLVRCIYFSGMTLTTLGYGDLHPVNDTGRIIAVIEALVGYLVLGLGVVAVSRFVEPFRPSEIGCNLDGFIRQLQEHPEVTRSEEDESARR